MKHSLALLLAIVLLIGFGASPASESETDLEITWHGQSMFTLRVSDGAKILTDPFDSDYYGIRYEVEPLVNIDVVTVSHEHEDHNHVDLALGQPRVLRGLSDDLSCADIDGAIEDVRFRTLCTCHVDETPCPSDRHNAVFIMETAELRLAHLGDLGHVLFENQLASMGQIDVLLIPVGGGTTIDADKATRVVGQIQPRVIIPMHYRTPGLYWGIHTATPFLEGKEVVRVEERSFTLRASDLPSVPTVYVLRYE